MIIATTPKLTGADALGPFYLPGAPFRQDLAPGETGVDAANGQQTRLHMSGQVKNEQGAPIPGAVLDVWHASPPEGEKAIGVYDLSPDFKYRGRVTADAQGNYSLDTVIPGHYPFDDHPNSPYRPEHIHVVATQPGDSFHTIDTADDGKHIVVDSGAPLITQLYFNHDGQVDVDDQATDPYFQKYAGAERAMTLSRETQPDGTIKASTTLDFVLPTPLPSWRFHVRAA